MKTLAPSRSSQKTVYVLGAGCSRNYQNRSEVPGLKPPLDSDFFRMAAKVLTNKESIYAFHHLIFEMELLYHFRPYGVEALPKEWVEEPISLESTLTFLDLKVQSASSRERERFEVARDLLIKLVRLTLNEALKGPACSLHRRLTQLVKENDAVISYNYDILADNALLLNGVINENSYLIPFRKVRFSEEWVNPRTSISNVKLIKLHGSLNWLFCNRCSSLLCYLGTKAPEDYSSDRPIDTCPHCGSGEVGYVLVPPILHKSYGQPSMRLLWNTAELELGGADRVVVIGYSMPPTDFRSELLFRSALGDKKVLVNVVNPDRQILNRFESLCRPIKQLLTVTHYTSLEEFLDEEKNS